MNIRHTLSLLGALTCATMLPLVAQETTHPATSSSQSQSAQPEQDTPIMLASSLRYRGPIRLVKPILSDSLDVLAKAYDATSAVGGLIDLRPDAKQYTTIASGAGNIFVTAKAKPQSVGEVQNHLYAFYLLPATYSKGTLRVECSEPWTLYHDGKQIASGQGRAIVDSIAPTTQSITLTPTLHTLQLRVAPSLTDDSANEIQLRLGFTPERKDADIRLLSHPERYPDLQYMIYGTTLSGVRISPSGRYSILYVREPVAGKPTLNKAYLYEEGKKIGELAGVASRASWLPKQDKLYYDEVTAVGRTLYYLDPKTMTRETIVDNLPEGGYQIAPNESQIIFFPEEKGPEYKKTLDRFESADERINGFRSRYFLAQFSLEDRVYRRLTFGARSTGLLDIATDDSKLIYTVSTPTPTEIPFSRSDYYELDLKTMTLDTLFANPRGINDVSYTSDSRYLLVRGSAEAFDRVGCVLPRERDVNTFDNQLFLYDRKTHTARPLTKTLDRTIASYQVSRTQFEAFFTAEVGDRKVLYRIDLATGAISRLSHREDVVKTYAIASRGSGVMYIGQSALSADRLYRVDARRGKEHLVYDLSADKMRDIQPGEVHDWDWAAPDGTKIQGRYYLPHGFDPTRQYPMLVYYYGGTSPVHRGFEGAYSLAMYASLGYVVYSLNPSGATGYGQEFASRHINAWGDRTASEIIGAVQDFCRQHPFVNAKKIGCMGASYGGFMTQYLQTQTDIFAAATSHAGISALSSYWGEGYWGVGYSTIASKGSYPWNNPRLYTEHSPLFLADRIHTPLLLIHGLSDTNVPVGESWQMFNALRILGRPVEFIGVYGEDHHILEPQKRYEWSSAIMAFFAKYLQDDPTWWDDLFPKSGI